MRKKRVGGFTLIELMLVVAIIALLAAIAIPKFADMLIKAKEAGVKGKTGAFRSALTIYYADLEGYLPFTTNVPTALVPKYISEIPSISIPTVSTHRNSNIISVAYAQYADWGSQRAWYYDGTTPRVIVNCVHRDTRGSSWSKF